MSDYASTGPDVKEARRKRTPEDFDPLFTEDPVPKKIHDLDSEKHRKLHTRLMALYSRELSIQEENRRQQAKDEDFYDNEQWSEEDKAVMEERGQMALVFNVIANAVDWILGTERRMRTDFKVLPRRKEGGKQAEKKTQLMKYLEDVNRTAFDVSRAFADAVKVGIGWLEDGVQDDSEGEPIYSRYESWRNMLRDSAGTELDLSDARYVFRSKWVDEDVAIALAPDRVDVIRGAIDSDRTSTLEEDGDEAMDSLENDLDGVNEGSYDSDHQRRRLRLIECWYRTPIMVDVMKGGDFRGEVYEPGSRGHEESLKSGEAQLIKKTVYRMHVAIMTTNALVYVSESPYRHNSFPFTPIFGKIRGRNNQPYGVIRNSRDIQVDVNKRAAKALHILSTNKVVMDEGAVDDLDEFQEEMARPDSVIVKKPNKALDINVDRELAPAHLQLMANSIKMIQSVSGVTEENQGMQTNATSGKAIQARQDQGALSTSGYFDNLRYARQVQGEKQLSLIEQFFTEEKQFRITNMRGRPEYVTVNDGMPENDVALTKADFIISEESWNATRRQAEVETLFNLIGQLGQAAPQLALVMVDLLVESMDLGNREELVKRIRQVTGQRDPDAEELTPEEQAQEQAKQQQQEFQMRMAMAELAEKEGKAAKAQADAQKAGADSQLAGVKAQEIMANMAGTNVSTQKAALEAALAMLSAPAVVPVADTVLHEAGFMSRTENEQNAQQQALIEQAQAEEQAMAEQAAMEQQAQQTAQPGQPAPNGAPAQ